MDRVTSPIKAAICSAGGPKPVSEPGSPRVDRLTSVETRPHWGGRASGTFSNDTYHGGWDDLQSATGPSVAIWLPTARSSCPDLWRLAR
jgi:hypothetical protein